MVYNNLSGRYTDQIMSKTQAQMVNPPDMTRPKSQIPANNIEPTLDIGCTPNNHGVEQGMNRWEEDEEDDVESILSLSLDSSAFLAPEEDDEDTPPSLNLGSGLALDLKDVTMNNSTTVISAGELFDENIQAEGTRDHQLPKVFLKTASISISVLQLLDSLAHPEGSASRRSNEQDFGEENLVDILQYVSGLTETD
ncbi:uncharacterized protein IAS62_000768 [Cryptococcus decagattii]|uniref:Uncharacterized protein n=1 Tax=Cryptococcus decagattii TaxID=1859122 RepID=A0ABZ2AMB1_9TREE